MSLPTRTPFGHGDGNHIYNDIYTDLYKIDITEEKTTWP